MRSAWDGRPLALLTKTAPATATSAHIAIIGHITQTELAPHTTTRAEAHTIRLALIYALLDGEHQIQAEHLHAALALWDYTSRSARWALGQATGDPLAEQLHAALIRAPDGLTRTQLSHHVHRNLPAEQLDRALQALAAAGRARRTRITTGGRPAERWHTSIPA
jgi:hypothetical protein